MTIDVALDTFEKLNFEQKNIFYEVLSNRLRDYRREDIYQSYCLAKGDLYEGRLNPELPSDFFSRMDNEIKENS